MSPTAPSSTWHLLSIFNERSLIDLIKYYRARREESDKKGSDKKGGVRQEGRGQTRRDGSEVHL